MNYYMMTTGQRDISPYIQNIPGIQFSVDRKRQAFINFQHLLSMATENAAVFMEDDVILCKRFCERVEEEIMKKPGDVIQFFSMRKDDISIGSRYIIGSKYIANLCFCLPHGMAEKILLFSRTWDKLSIWPTANDLCIVEYLKANRLKYWNVVPNLVDHQVGVSLIRPGRSQNRRSLTFRNE
jgi:hypothetical protein